MTLDEFVKKSIDVPFLECGRSFDGWDCWGLIVCAYREVLGIDLSSYDFVNPNNTKLAFKLSEEETKKWKAIDLGEEREFDVLLLRPCHVGLVIKPKLMLHAMEKVNTIIVNYSTLNWKLKIMGAYRRER